MIQCELLVRVEVVRILHRLDIDANCSILAMLSFHLERDWVVGVGSSIVDAHYGAIIKV